MAPKQEINPARIAITDMNESLNKARAIALIQLAASTSQTTLPGWTERKTHGSIVPNDSASFALPRKDL